MTATFRDATLGEVEEYEREHPIAAAWAEGYGVIRHTLETRGRVYGLVERLHQDRVRDSRDAFEVLRAADRIANAAMWLVVHETYAARVYTDGRPLGAGDFKANPEGHTGGALNIVPAYTGYIAANALEGFTRSWVMGQGHTVAAVDSVNLLLDNMLPRHAERYDYSDEGLTRYVRDFYSLRLDDAGKQDSPLGSHVNVHTAGGMMEGGYLGFTELQYVHMPLPGERLVAFLSDGAFEEQRGSDWAPRWWRPQDSGLVAPIMILNGRRIDQRSTLAQAGGTAWLLEYLRLAGFDPLVFDGRDPAAFAWAIFEMEYRLREAGREVAVDPEALPAALPYGIATAPKGAGFYGEGTNLAHNLPLPGNPSKDSTSAEFFNEHAGRLWVAADVVEASRLALNRHDQAGRAKERDHALANRDVPLPVLPPSTYLTLTGGGDGALASPMAAIDETFIAICRANPQLRPRVGNPDEMKSNRMLQTLNALKFRVTAPEPGLPESTDGAVITALNEEAVSGAALGNKGGINITVTYEAFGVKMLGNLRQEIIFAQHMVAAGKPPGWLSVPTVLTSHTWENGKNEQSHQDPTLAEALLGEASHVSRVVFPIDYNSAQAALRECYGTHGQYWAFVVPKTPLPVLFDPETANRFVREGAVEVVASPQPRLILTAIGAFQLVETLRASQRLQERGVEHRVIAMLEPGRFRAPRDEREAAINLSASVRERLYPETAPARIFVTHTRPEAILGALSTLHTGRGTAGLGFLNQGGTLDVHGMLFINRSTWAHILSRAAGLLRIDTGDLLTEEERAALDGQRTPHGVIIPER